MQEINQNSTIARCPEHLACELDNQKVVMDCNTGEYFQLNEVGARIWDLIENPIHISKLVGLLTAEFQIDSDIAEKEALDFLKNILQKKLITLIPIHEL